MVKIKKLILERGFVAIFIAILILVIILAIGLSVSNLVLNLQKVSGNVTRSNQAYFTAEAGIEDALLRLAKGKQWQSSYSFSVEGSTTAVGISDVIGGSRTITSQGNFSNRIRKTQVVYQISTDEISFHYGVQVGDLGLQMAGNAVVHGNIFSNGIIAGASNTKIYGDAISAGANGKIQSIEIKSTEGGGSAWARYLQDCKIDGDAYYTSISSCSVKGSLYQTEEWVAPQQMPITDEQITSWKNDAAAGGTISGYSLGGNNEASLGPVKVDGNMTLDSNAILTITGTIWVTGNLSLNSNVALQLASGYGSFSGVIVVDGHISVASNVTLCGAEGYNKTSKKCNSSMGSYLMLLSTNNSTDPGNPAISATSNTKTAILYASDGFISLSSNAKLREATGYGISMSSNAEVTYVTGLADAKFSSGPGGKWKVTSWKEVE